MTTCNDFMRLKGINDRLLILFSDFIVANFEATSETSFFILLSKLLASRTFLKTQDFG